MLDEWCWIKAVLKNEIDLQINLLMDGKFKYFQNDEVLTADKKTYHTRATISRWFN